MVQSIISINEREDRILNIVKAKYGLKNKSQAISIVLNIYGDSFLESELRPEFVLKLEKIEKEKGIPFSNIEELKKIIEG